MILTDSAGGVLLLLRVVTDAQGEAVLRLGSVYRPPGSQTLGGVFEDLLGWVADGPDGPLEPAAVKRLLKERVPTFSPAMTGHLLGLMAGRGAPEAVRVLRDQLVPYVPQGFLTTEAGAGDGAALYVDFDCFACHAGRPHVAFVSFNEAVDEFFSKIEQQKVQKALRQQEADAAAKLQSIRAEQAGRVQGLEASIELLLRRAQAIDAHPQLVADASLVVATALAAGMDWAHLEAVLAEEKKRGNPTALAMARLRLERGQVALQLGDQLVDVDVGLTPHANATRCYEQRRQAVVKLARTRDAMDRALRSAERKIRADLKQSVGKARRQQTAARRKALWFEKFHWFVSSDGLLVLSGRDMQQNELLVKRYLRAGDAYVHADMHGASSVVVKGRRGGAAPLGLPPRTLGEAGAMSLCHSRAWEAKIVTSAWWVHAAQVSKTAPSGEYLPTGSFMIRGRKNFLPPSPLLYGFGFMFVLDEAGRERQRAERGARDLLLAGDALADDTARYLNLLEADVSAEGGTVVVASAPAPKVQQPARPVRKQSSRQEQKAERAQAQAGGAGGTRGRAGKQKKIAKKYADQDDEERALRMRLLSSRKPAAAGASLSGAGATAGAGARGGRSADSGNGAKAGAGEVAAATTGEVEDASVGGIAEASIGGIADASAGEVACAITDGVADASGTTCATGNADAAGTANTNGPDDGDDEEQEAGEDELGVVDALAGSLRGNIDHVLYAIPVAGPVSALAGYTLRLKLAPGGLKRGKAVQQAMAILLADPRELAVPAWSPAGSEAVTPEEAAAMFKRVRDMVRAVPDADLNQTMLGHVKIMASAKDLAKSRPKKGPKK